MRRSLHPVLFASAIALFNVGGFHSLAAAKDAPMAANAYPPEVVKAFTDACVSGAGSAVDPKLMQQICSCTIGEIQAQYTLAEFVTVANTMEKTNALPPEVTQIVQVCAEQSVK